MFYRRHHVLLQQSQSSAVIPSSLRPGLRIIEQSVNDTVLLPAFSAKPTSMDCKGKHCKQQAKRQRTHMHTRRGRRCTSSPNLLCSAGDTSSLPIMGQHSIAPGMNPKNVWCNLWVQRYQVHCEQFTASQSDQQAEGTVLNRQETPHAGHCTNSS